MRYVGIITGCVLLAVLAFLPALLPESFEDPEKDPMYKTVCHSEYYLEDIEIARFCLDSYGNRQINTAPISRHWQFDIEAIFDSLAHELIIPKDFS